MQRIFLGDVQGCAEELVEILDRAELEFGEDAEFWFVGDLVNRGPDNLRVLEEVRTRVEAGRARAVLGNHEVGLLGLAWGQREAHRTDTVTDLLGRPDAQEWIDWIRRLPVLETGRLGERPFAMVHASSAPGWTLEELTEHAEAIEAQLSDPDEAVARAFVGGEIETELRDHMRRMLTCRSHLADGWSKRLPEEEGEGARPWHEAWREQSHRHALVYGHWALQGLHVADSLRGIDTACVHHGNGSDGFLTAWLPDESRPDPFALPDAGFWQVPARRSYYRI